MREGQFHMRLTEKDEEMIRAIRIHLITNRLPDSKPDVVRRAIKVYFDKINEEK
jgi:hypothetical protein